jgi:antitoxin MazE
MKTVIRPIGNSQGILIPKAILDQLAIARDDIVEIEIRGGALVLRKPAPQDRAGWAEGAAQLANEGDDKSVWPDFGNAGDEDLRW